MNLVPSSLRARIQLWHGLLLALVLTAFGITAHRVHWEGETRRVDRELDEPISILHRSMHARNVRSLTPDSQRLRDLPPPADFALPEDVTALFASREWRYAVWARNGRLLAKSDALPADIAMPLVDGLIPFVTQRQSTGAMREAYIVTPGGECLLAAQSMEEELRAASRLGWWLFAFGAGVLAAGLCVDAWILRRAIRPVEQIISAAEHVSRGDLSTRIEANGSSAEMRRLTHVLNSTFASLDRAFTQQARFSADVAHELRTPVSVLIAEAQTTLERERSGEDYRDTISACLRSARRMNGLIESLLALAQIQSGSDTTRAPCDLALLAGEVIDSLRSLAATHGIELRTTLDPATCEGDAAQLTQIITNLLSNAIQHNQRGGHALIETNVEDGCATLRVSNTGPAIPAGDVPHVFERFYRADASRNRKTGGVGLGLAICKAIADAHDAELTVESTPGETTSFSLRLPQLNSP